MGCSSRPRNRLPRRGALRRRDGERRGRESGDIASAFPIEANDQIMLVTSTGQSIRIPVDGVSYRSRGAGGVKLFNTSPGEEVVSVAWIAETGNGDNGNGDNGNGDGGTGDGNGGDAGDAPVDGSPDPGGDAPDGPGTTPDA